MIKQNELSKRLSAHIGHEVAVVQHGSGYHVRLECEDCGEVILDSILDEFIGKPAESLPGRAFVMRGVAADTGRFDEVYSIVVDNILALAMKGQVKAPLADILPTEGQYAEHGLGAAVRALFPNDRQAAGRLAPLFAADGFELRTEAARVSHGGLTEWYVSW